MTKMGRDLSRRVVLAGFAATLALSGAVYSDPAQAAEKKDFKVCWSIYAGWMPWGQIQESGLMKKWADKYGISVEIVQINDYVESINQYTAGAYDGCSMTNMDALSIPAGGGVDTTALIIGDYSNHPVANANRQAQPAIAMVPRAPASKSYVLARAPDSINAAPFPNHRQAPHDQG